MKRMKTIRLGLFTKKKKKISKISQPTFLVLEKKKSNFQKFGKRLLSNFPIFRSKVSNPLKILIIVSRTLLTLDNFCNASYTLILNYAPIKYFILLRYRFKREDLNASRRNMTIYTREIDRKFKKIFARLSNKNLFFSTFISNLYRI